MDIQLKELIETIKQDGLRSAEEAARKIIEDAETRARGIIFDAEKRQKKSIQGLLKRQTETNVPPEAIKQAGRDLILKLNAQIRNIFRVLLEAEFQSSFRQISGRCNNCIYFKT